LEDRTLLAVWDHAINTFVTILHILVPSPTFKHQDVMHHCVVVGVSQGVLQAPVTYHKPFQQFKSMNLSLHGPSPELTKSFF